MGVLECPQGYPRVLEWVGLEASEGEQTLGVHQREGNCTLREMGAACKCPARTSRCWNHGVLWVGLGF